jgi:hypothetical protein
MSIRDVQVSVPASLFHALWSDFVEYREARIDQWGDAGDLFGRVWCVLGSSADVVSVPVRVLSVDVGDHAGAEAVAVVATRGDENAAEWRVSLSDLFDVEWGEQ